MRKFFSINLKLLNLLTFFGKFKFLLSEFNFNKKLIPHIFADL